ncbi:geranylgeranyl reductase family protein [uncultured Corynebacterium sp.]|uniref:geranylgeranyl reductase family protein n=1 Tax=uncultured Corynebacterium sp. TaxID=159447 RepID=UPI00259B1A5D|nr:geranylgeranyl reductase family protein [uncultured Corynebacterium sp.]
MWHVNEFVDLVVVGAGPAGSAAAIAAQRAGLRTLLLDAQGPRRDKTCGDGLTPRAVDTLHRLGLDVPAYRNRGLKLHGFGGDVVAPWPRGEGSASPRATFDAMLVDAASRAGADVRQNTAATGVQFDGSAISAVETTGGVVRTRWVVVADGVRSPFGKLLGRQWHRGQVYGIAARSYCASPFANEPWMHSHVELRDADGEIQPGYGWIFPLGDGHVNLGCGALSTDARPAKVNTKKLLSLYASQQREQWQLGQEQDVASALLPMGGAVSNVAGPNWALVGDAAACVNPLNGEGIDYGLETAVLAVELIAQGGDLTLAWPALLREHYGDAFTLARTLARLLTYPQFLPLAGPVALRGLGGKYLMPAAARLMGNLVTDEDRDLVARAWRVAGKGARAAAHGQPLWDAR